MKAVLITTPGGAEVMTFAEAVTAAEVRAAHEYLESNETFGKIILDFSA